MPTKTATPASISVLPETCSLTQSEAHASHRAGARRCHGPSDEQSLGQRSGVCPELPPWNEISRSSCRLWRSAPTTYKSGVAPDNICLHQPWITNTLFISGRAQHCIQVGQHVPSRLKLELSGQPKSASGSQAMAWELRACRARGSDGSTPFTDTSPASWEKTWACGSEGYWFYSIHVKIRNHPSILGAPGTSEPWTCNSQVKMVRCPQHPQHTSQWKVQLTFKLKGELQNLESKWP